MRWRAMRIFRHPQEKKLLAALTARGAKEPWAAADAAWAAFKDYARTVILGGGNGLLFQVGTHDFEGRPMFYFDSVCQFQLLDANGEHEGFEQLHCELSCPPRPELGGVETNLWSFEFEDAEAFFAAVEALPGV